MVTFFDEFEEDVGLLGFYIGISQLIDLRDASRKSIHVAKSVMLRLTQSALYLPMN
jgi:hypothetical protein